MLAGLAVYSRPKRKIVWQDERASSRGYSYRQARALYLTLYAKFLILSVTYRPLVFSLSIMNYIFFLRKRVSRSVFIRNTFTQLVQQRYKSQTQQTHYIIQRIFMNVQKSVSGSAEPILCQLCQSFYGSQNTKGLCSTCYKSSKPEVASEKKQTSTVVSVESAPVEVKEIPIEKEDVPQEEKEEVRQVDKKRCFTCQKKVGLLGLECKCTFVFCNSHRMPEDHKCEFNFKERGLKQLQKKAIKVEASKITQI